MFTNLRMVNFKSWKDTGDVRLAPLTVLFGGNSTGKSGLLQMLLLLKQTTESRDRNQVLQTGTDDPRSYVELGTLREITHFDEKELKFTIEWDWPETEHWKRPLSYVKPQDSRETTLRSLRLNMNIWAKPAFPSLISYHQGQGESETLSAWSHQYVGKAHPYAYDFGITFGERDGVTDPGERGPGAPNSGSKCYSIPPYVKNSLSTIAYSNATHLINEMEWRFEEQFRQLHFLGPLREYPRRVYTWTGERPGNVGLRGERAVPALLAKELNSHVFARLKQMGMAESFEVRPVVEGGDLFRVHVRFREKSQEVLLPEVGFGVSQVLPVLVQCLYAPQYSTIILEHPDLHLHPSAQAGLADFLIEVMKIRDLQLIVESHSEHFLRRLQRRAAEEALHPDEVALYFCDIENGISRLEELHLDVFGRISNWPDGFFGDMDGDILAVLDKGLGRKIAANA